MSATGIIDTHCHLFHERLRADQAEIAERAVAAGVTACVVPAVDLVDARETCRLAERNFSDGCYGLRLGVAVGVHPHQVAPAEAAIGLRATITELRALASAGPVVAVGEIGLDLARGAGNLQQQLRWLRAQLDLAVELGLPVILHTRGAAREMERALRQWLQGAPAPPGSLSSFAGVLHSFTGEPGLASLAAERWFALGVGGISTFAREKGLRQQLAELPIDCQVLETDAPYLAPHPHRGRRNEPARITSVAECMASARGDTQKAVCATTRANALALFPRLQRLL